MRSRARTNAICEQILNKGEETGKRSLYAVFLSFFFFFFFQLAIFFLAFIIRTYCNFPCTAPHYLNAGNRLALGPCACADCICIV